MSKQAKYFGKAEECGQRILEAFRAGTVPGALAQVFIRREGRPMDSWSWTNQLLCALAGSFDSRGFRQWQDVGRTVNKGERAHHILVPLFRKFRSEDPETGETVEGKYIYAFKSVAVFALEQTDGEPLADDDDVPRLVDDLPWVEVARSWGLSVSTYNGEGAGFLGMYRYDSTDRGVGIAIGTRNLSTWAHELVHAADHRCGTLTRGGGQRADNEIVAELGGAVLLSLAGLEHDADLGGCLSHLERYSDGDPVRAATALLTRTCEAVALILDSAEKLAQTASEAA